MKKVVKKLKCLLALFCLLFSYAVASDKSTDVSDDQLRNLLFKEIKKCLNDKSKFVLLPYNIESVHLSPFHKPTFQVRTSSKKKYELSDVNKNILNDKNFRLLPEGRFLASNKKGEVVITLKKKLSVLVGKDIFREVKLPNKSIVKNAYFLSGKWFFETSLGVYSEDGKQFIKTIDQNYFQKAIIKEKNKITLLLKKIGRSANKKIPFVIRTINEEGSSLVKFPNQISYGLKTVLHMKDNKWFLIAHKLGVIQNEPKVKPTLEALEKALEAAESGDRAALDKSLAHLTRFNTKYLVGLIHSLKAIPSKKGINIHSIVRSLSYEFQFYDGYWIKDIKLMHQKDLTKALLTLKYVDQKTAKESYGLFVIKNDGCLEKISSSKDNLPQGCVYAGDYQGSELLFFPKHGLAKIDKGLLSWLDSSDTMKSMDSYLGLDNLGRMYFSQSSSFSSGVTHYYKEKVNWVYQLEGTSKKEEDFLFLPFDKNAIVDSLGRIWFVQNVTEARNINYNFKDDYQTKVLSEEDRLISGARSLPLTWLNNLGISHSGHSGYTLFCYAEGKLIRYFSSPTLYSAQLIAGSNGSVILLNRYSSGKSFLIEKNAVTVVSNMHEYTKNSFNKLLNYLPMAKDTSWKVTRPGICRVGSVIWVSQDRKVEAYRDGKSLGIFNQLSEFERKGFSAELFGSLEDQTKSMILMTKTRSLSHVYWARELGEKIIVTPTSKSGRKIPGGIRGDTDSYSGRPLIVKNHAKVYFSSASIGLLEYSSPSKLKETFRSLGAPAMMLSSGALLTFKSPYNRGGYCLTKGEISRDQSVSFVHQLMISAELANKQLLGLTPTGPVLLKSNKKGQYEFCYRPRLNNLFSLISYIGKSNSGHVFVAKDRGHKKHLVIHQMRPTK